MLNHTFRTSIAIAILGTLGLLIGHALMAQGPDRPSKITITPYDDEGKKGEPIILSRIPGPIGPPPRYNTPYVLEESDGIDDDDDGSTEICYIETDPKLIEVGPDFVCRGSKYPFTLTDLTFYETEGAESYDGFVSGSTPENGLGTATWKASD